MGWWRWWRWIGGADGDRDTVQIRLPSLARGGPDDVPILLVHKEGVVLQASIDEAVRAVWRAKRHGMVSSLPRCPDHQGARCVIHYHGLPITPETAAVAAVRGRHAFVSWAHPGQVTTAMAVCQSFALDNGAFSAWRAGRAVTNWTQYYAWVEAHRVPALDFAVIPDVIDGSEADNDALVREWPWGQLGAPVWHLHEALQRLERLASDWPRVCLGSSGEFARVGSSRWWDRMAEAVRVVSDARGRPRVRLHGLRMLDARVVAVVPLASADSTNIARNIGIDSAWRGTYQPATKEGRAVVIRDRIEMAHAPSSWVAET